MAEHAVHFWNGARDTLVENNVIVNCSRGIGFGLGDAGGGVGHHGGLIRNNALLADIPQYDTGIELHQAQGSRVIHNTIAETERATSSFSSIDYRFANTDVEIRNNLVRRITQRDGGRATLSHNVEQLPLGWLARPAQRGLPPDRGRDRRSRSGRRGARRRPRHRRPPARLRPAGHRGRRGRPAGRLAGRRAGGPSATPPAR